MRVRPLQKAAARAFRGVDGLLGLPGFAVRGLRSLSLSLSLGLSIIGWDRLLLPRLILRRSPVILLI